MSSQWQAEGTHNKSSYLLLGPCYILGFIYSSQQPWEAGTLITPFVVEKETDSVLTPEQVVSQDDISNGEPRGENHPSKLVCMPVWKGD